MRSRDRWCVVFGAAALLVSVLVVGGVYRWTQAIVALLLILAVATQFTARRKLDELSPVIVLIAAAIGLTTLQLLPLPASLVAALSPTNAALRADGAALLGTSPWSCISMDVANTLRGLSFLVILLGVALVSLRLASAQRGRYLLLSGIALTSGLVAIVTIAHMVVNATRIYGIFDVPETLPIIGPLVNANHLGCLMALGATLSVGLAFYENQASSLRATWILVGVACVAVALLSESRGAAVALAIGVVVTSTLLISRRLGDLAREGRRRTTTGSLPTSIVLTLGFGLAVYASAGGVAEQLGRTHLGELDHATSKFAAWQAAPQIVRESPWVGIGRGAVEPVFTHAFPGTAYATFTHVENEYVETVLEFGIPGALLLAVLFGWTVVTALRKWRDGPLAAAALGALAGISFQSSVDFGVRLLGVAIPAVVIVCTLLPLPLRETTRHLRQRFARGALIAALAGCALLLLLPVTSTLREDHEALLVGEYRSTEAIAEVAQRHPLDYFAFGAAGQQLIRARDPRAGEFLNHALRLHPNHPGLHRIVARLLIAKGSKSQAALEYATAMQGAPPHSLLKEIVTMLPEAEDAASAIPINYPRPASVLRSLAELKRQDVAVQWLIRRVLVRPSDERELVDALFDLAFESKDYPTALRAAHARQAIADTATSKLKIARVLFEQHDYTAVYALLADVETWRGSIEDRGAAWLLVCDSYHAEQKWDDALRCLRRLDASGSLANRRREIVKREREVSDRRASEIRLKQLQSLDQSLKLPLPIVPTDGLQEPILSPLTETGFRNSIHPPLVPGHQ